MERLGRVKVYSPTQPMLTKYGLNAGSRAMDTIVSSLDYRPLQRSNIILSVWNRVPLEVTGVEYAGDRCANRSALTCICTDHGVKV